MAKLVTISVPTTAGIGMARGYVSWLNFNGGRIKCFLQLGEDDKPEYVTHYASGYRFPTHMTIPAWRAMRYVANPYNKVPSDREAAQTLLSALEASVQPEKIAAAFAKAPTINR